MVESRPAAVQPVEKAHALVGEAEVLSHPGPADRGARQRAVVVLAEVAVLWVRASAALLLLAPVLIAVLLLFG